MEIPFLPRAAGPLLEKLLRVFPVVAVMGARQVGKTTLVRNLPAVRQHRYLTLDDLDLRLQAEADSQAFLKRGNRLILDEVQRVPELLLAIKRSVDEYRLPGQFVLTGSAHLLLHARLSDTLAGRAAYLVVWPMTRREQRGFGTTGPWRELLATPVEAWPALLKEAYALQEDWREAVARGGFLVPALLLKDWEERLLWIRGYLQTYLEGDVPALRAVENLPELRRLLEVIALCSGSLLNQSELARDLGLSQPTVHRYLNLLEVTFLLVRLQGYARSRTKRLIKAPKAYLPDPAIALYLTGGRPIGAHLETLVLLDLLAFVHGRSERPGLYYWPTASGQEVDFVLEAEGGLLPVEVKVTVRPTPKDAQGLLAFLNEYPEAKGACSCTGGGGLSPGGAGGGRTLVDGGLKILPCLPAASKGRGKGVYRYGMERDEDEELIRRVVRRDEDALLTLYRRHGPHVHALARRILRDGDLAKSIVQDTFLRIWNKAERFDPQLGTPRTWILTIAHRLALKALRGRRETLPLEDWDAPIDAVGTEEHLDRIRVSRALDALDGEERRLLQLAYFHGYSHSELALLLGWPLGTVKSRLRRALKKLEVELR